MKNLGSENSLLALLLKEGAKIQRANCSPSSRLPADEMMMIMIMASVLVGMI
jgi:hypothetical protein